jgi:hypothetical protein
MKLRSFLTVRKGVFIAVILLIIFTLYTIVSPIREVECINLDHPCHEPIITRLNQTGKGKPAFLAMRALGSYLTTENRVINSRMIYSFPRKIRVDIITREPSIAIRPAGVNEYTLFDETGRVIDVVNETSLPTLTISQAINASQISFVAQMYASLVTYFGVTSGEIIDNALKVRIAAMSQPFDFNYPVEGDVDRLLGATRIVLGELNVEHENPTMKTIDFRFKNPVVKKL